MLAMMIVVRSVRILMIPTQINGEDDDDDDDDNDDDDEK